MSDSNSKIYLLDSKKVARSVWGNIALDAFVSTINRVHNTIVNDYPEAKNFRLQFQFDEKDVDILLTYDRYEADYDRIEIVEEEPISSLIKKVVCVAIIALSMLTYYFCSTDSTENIVNTSPQSTSVSGTETKDTSESDQEVQPKRRPKYRVTFRNSQDVYLYLHGKSFVSDNGTVVSFDSGGRNVYANGKLIYTDVRVLEVRSDKAIVKFVGPYGGSTFSVMLDDNGHYIFDVNDRTIYERKTANLFFNH